MSKYPEPADIQPDDDGIEQKQCPSCLGWYSPQGYPLHSLRCSGDASTDNSTDESGESAAKSEGSDVPTLSVGDDENDDECPVCGHGEALVDAEQAADALEQNGYEESAQKAREADHYCNGCHKTWVSQ